MARKFGSNAIGPRGHRLPVLIIGVVSMFAAVAPSSAVAPGLSFDRGVHQIRKFVRYWCGQKCKEWRVTQCRRRSRVTVDCRMETVLRSNGEECDSRALAHRSGRRLGDEEFQYGRSRWIQLGVYESDKCIDKIIPWGLPPPAPEVKSRVVV
jgi:hypothetical protein